MSEISAPPLTQKQIDAEVLSYHLDESMRSVLRFNEQGLIAAIVQDRETNDVLMMAWMDEHALAYTLATHRGTYWSRSRQEYWIKGMTSGHTQKVYEVHADCDGDALLVFVEQKGAACHTGTRSCFDVHVLDSQKGKEEKQ